MNFFTKYKKIFFIIGFVLITTAWGYFIYFLFFKTSPMQTQTPITENKDFSGDLPVAETGEGNTIPNIKPSNNTVQNEITELPDKKPDIVAKGNITEAPKLNNNNSISATIDSSGSNVQYYNKDDGKFYRLDSSGNTVALSDKVFHDVQNISWSPVKNKAILEYPDGSNILYNFDEENQITLPSHWEDFSFSKTGDKIVMKSIAQDVENRWLAIANDDGSKSKSIENIGLNADKVLPSWSPNNQSIAMYIEGIDFNRQEVFFVGLNDENFKSTIIEGRGFEPLWNENGDRLLYSVYSTDNNLKPKLWAVDAQGDSIGNGRIDLNVETWAHKCSFANNTTVYCAVPESLEEGAGVFPETAKNTKDQIYRIDISSGTKQLIAVPSEGYNISNLIITENEREVFFTDSATGNLHKIRLK